MTKYGYLINKEYQAQEGEILWLFTRWEAENTPINYIGIESANENITTNENFVVVGDSEAFQNWLITGFEPSIDVI